MTRWFVLGVGVTAAVLTTFFPPETEAGRRATGSGAAATAGPNVARADRCESAYEPYVDLVARHLAWYPAMESDDVYKLVYQSLAGPGHAAPSREQAAAWLEAEIARLQADSSRARDPAGGTSAEPLRVPLRPDSSLVRVNLRPYLAAGRDPDVLLTAFLETADAVRPGPDALAADFEGVWSCLITAAARDRLPADTAALRLRLETAAAEGFPAIHHSTAYESAYRPAYRVIERSRLCGVAAQLCR